MATLTTDFASVGRQVAETRRLLSASLTDELAVLGAEYVAGSGTVTLTSAPKRLGPGTVLSCQENTWYVLSVTGSVCQVIAGYEGNDDVDKDEGSVVRVAPRFTDYQLFSQIRQTVSAMSGRGLYGIVRWEVSGTSEDFFEFPDEVDPYLLKVLQVRSEAGGATDWVINPSWEANYVTGGKYVRIYSPALRHQIIAAIKIAPPETFDADMIVNCGLRDSMLDIPALGSAATLMLGQEARRMHMEAQGDPRRSELVSMTGASSAARELRRQFDVRCDEEYARLLVEVPISKQVFQ